MSGIIEDNVPFTKIACNTCKHFKRDIMTSNTCEAFENIPREILIGENMHTEPLRGQRNDIIYERE